MSRTLFQVLDLVKSICTLWNLQRTQCPVTPCSIFKLASTHNARQDATLRLCNSIASRQATVTNAQ